MGEGKMDTTSPWLLELMTRVSELWEEISYDELN